jgi:Domain of unknown function (DUF4260)
LRTEGLVVFAGAIAAFLATDEAWWLLPALLLVPDLGMVGYLASPRTGALTYNLVHAYPAPALLGTIGIVTDTPLAVAFALVWLAHIGMDRMCGFGLKYDTGFGDTHLGRIGKAGAPGG